MRCRGNGDGGGAREGRRGPGGAGVGGDASYGAAAALGHSGGGVEEIF